MTGRFLSLDVSSTAAGWAVFDGESLATFGLVAPRGSACHRIDTIADAAAALRAEHGCSRAVMEWGEGRTAKWLRKAGRRAEGMAPCFHAQGAVRESLRACGVVTTPVSENEWTRGASKENRALSVATEFPAYAARYGFAVTVTLAGGKAEVRSKGDPGFDVADAIGLGLWFVGRRREQEIVRRAGGGLGINLDAGRARK